MPLSKGKGRLLHRVWCGAYLTVGVCWHALVCRHATKTVTFFGYGMTSSDVAVWVHRSAYKDADCTDPALQLLPAGTQLTATNDGLSATAVFGPFPQLPAASGVGFKLCYSFGHDGLFRLLPEFTVDVVKPSVHTVSVHAADGSGNATTGTGMRAVAGRSSVFTFEGVGVSVDDAFKFVPKPGGVVTNDYCDGFGSTLDVPLRFQSQSGMRAWTDATVISANSGGARLVLCYRHGDSASQSPSGCVCAFACSRGGRTATHVIVCVWALWHSGTRSTKAWFWKFRVSLHRPTPSHPVR